MTRHAAEKSDPARLEGAAAWHARLHDGHAPDWAAFTAWLEEDPCNRLAFDAVDMAAAEATEAWEQRGSAPEARLPVGFARRAAFAASVLAAAGLALAVILPPLLRAPAEVLRVATTVGEQRDVTLADGSVLHVNTATSLTATLDGDSRGVRLDKGEVLLEVARDPKRPFHVMAGDREVTVVGTTFNVVRDAGAVNVSVAEGIVQVQSGAAAVRLQPGDRYRGREGSPAYALTKSDPAAVTAWREGQLIFEEASLADVVSTMNRYFERQITPAPEVRNLRFSGVLKMDDQVLMLRRLEAFLPVAVRESGNELHLERSTSK